LNPLLNRWVSRKPLKVLSDVLFNHKLIAFGVLLENRPTKLAKQFKFLHSHVHVFVKFTLFVQIKAR